MSRQGTHDSGRERGKKKLKILGVGDVYRRRGGFKNKGRKKGKGKRQNRTEIEAGRTKRERREMGGGKEEKACKEDGGGVGCLFL